MSSDRERTEPLPRLPKLVENDPSAARLKVNLGEHQQPLWQSARLQVARVPLNDGLRRVLVAANRAGRLVRGLEGCNEVLDAEARGQAKVDQRSAQARGVRVSRLLLLTDDGAERFYRQVEHCVFKQEGRVMALRLMVDAAEFGEFLFGPGRPTRAVMLTHKESVAAALLATAP